MSKHSAITSGDGFTAFIDGIPDKCKHDDLGGNCFETVSGKIITPRTFIKWAGYTSVMRDQLIHKHFDNADDPIAMMCVSCSKCGKPHLPNPFEFEI